jgi:hypothetical protein
MAGGGGEHFLDRRSNQFQGLHFPVIIRSHLARERMVNNWKIKQIKNSNEYEEQKWGCTYWHRAACQFCVLVTLAGSHEDPKNRIWKQKFQIPITP